MNVAVLDGVKACRPRNGPANTVHGEQPSLRGSRYLLYAALALLLSISVSDGLAQETVPNAEVPTFKVGDRWKFQLRDGFSGVTEQEFVRVVTAVTDAEIVGTEETGTFRMTRDFSVVDSPTSTNSSRTRRIDFPISVGKQWAHTFEWARKGSDLRGDMQLAAHVVSYERLRVPAGEFDTYKVEFKGVYRNFSSGSRGRITSTTWYAPAARNVIRIEWDDGKNRSVTELVELQLAL